MNALILWAAVVGAPPQFAAPFEVPVPAERISRDEQQRILSTLHKPMLLAMQGPQGAPPPAGSPDSGERSKVEVYVEKSGPACVGGVCDVPPPPAEYYRMPPRQPSHPPTTT